jgi:hypothetical protein
MAMLGLIDMSLIVLGVCMLAVALRTVLAQQSDEESDVSYSS